MESESPPRGLPIFKRRSRRRQQNINNLSRFLLNKGNAKHYDSCVYKAKLFLKVTFSFIRIADFEPLKIKKV